MGSGKTKVVLCRISAPVTEGSLQYSPRAKAFGMFCLREYCMANPAIREHYDIDVAYFSTADGAESIVRELTSLNPDILGFSCYNTDYEISMNVAALVKKGLPQTKFFLGGPNVSDPEKELGKHAFADFIIPFEGELPLEELLINLVNGNDFDGIRGIAFRKDNEIIFTGLRDDAVDLSTYPEVFTEEFAANLSGSVIYQTSRGCKFNCAYCLSAGQKYREFPMERVKRELPRLLNNPTIDYISLADLDVAANPERLVDLLTFIKENNKRGIYFFAFISSIPKVVDFLDLLVDAHFVAPGRQEFCVAVQSGNPEVLSLAHRNWLTLKHLEELAPKILRRFPAAKVELILGLPGETLESQKQNIFDIFKLGFRSFHVIDFIVNPGSEFYRRRRELGLEYIDETTYVVKRTPTFSEFELSEARRFENNFQTLMRILDSRDMPLYESWNMNLIDIAESCDFLSDPRYLGSVDQNKTGINYLENIDIAIIDALIDFLRRERAMSAGAANLATEYLRFKFMLSRFENGERATLARENHPRLFPLIPRHMKLLASPDILGPLGLAVDPPPAARIPVYALFNQRRGGALLLTVKDANLYDDFLRVASREQSTRGILSHFSGSNLKTVARMLRQLRDAGFFAGDPLAEPS